MATAVPAPNDFMNINSHTHRVDPFAPAALRRYFSRTRADSDYLSDDSLSPCALRAEFSSALNQVPATDTTTKLNCSLTLRR